MGDSLLALGAEGLPRELQLKDGAVFALEKVFQHGFWAATALYEGEAGQRLVKFGRRASFLLLPFGRLGQFLTNRELEMYDRCAGIEGVPGEYERIGKHGFARPFIPGHVLVRGEQVGDDFFPRFERMLEQVHERRIAIVDLQKVDNILVGDDGRPGLFDFQTAWYWPERGQTRGLQKLMPYGIGASLLRRFQEGDTIHTWRHWRRCRSDTMPAEKLERSRDATGFMRFHRVFMKGWRGLRRKLGLASRA